MLKDSQAKNAMVSFEMIEFVLKKKAWILRNNIKMNVVCLNVIFDKQRFSERSFPLSPGNKCENSPAKSKCKCIILHRGAQTTVGEEETFSAVLTPTVAGWGKEGCLTYQTYCTSFKIKNVCIISN